MTMMYRSKSSFTLTGDERLKFKIMPSYQYLKLPSLVVLNLSLKPTHPLNLFPSFREHLTTFGSSILRYKILNYELVTYKNHLFLKVHI